MRFLDRADAGKKLATALNRYRGEDVVVLALPRGGVPVAAEVARHLKASLDLLLVRKIGVPAQPELAMGAVIDGAAPIVVRNADIIRLAGISPETFDEISRREVVEIERRRQIYLGSRHAVEVAGRVAIIIDDGVATGATIKAAILAVKQRGPEKIVVAVPVASPAVVAELLDEVEDVVCLDQPADFDAVGSYYADFRQLNDDDVIRDLSASH